MDSIADLKFDEREHRYSIGERTVPGVTSILAPLIDFSSVPRDVLEAKADLGRRVHAACQFADEGDLDESSISDDVRPYLDAYQKFLRETGAEVVANERRVFHPGHDYAGTLDRVLRIQKMLWLTDLKTSFTTPLSAGPQTAAYLSALPLRVFGECGRAALRLRPDGSYRFDQLSSASDFPTFLACLSIHRFKETHK